jgi:nitrile hydratase subunit beta
MTRVLDAGRGARRALDRPGEGLVLAVYRKAVYLRMPAGLCALTTASAPRGPLHLRCATLPRCQPGSRVRTDGRLLTGEGWTVALEAPAWIGPLPGPERLAGAITPAEVAERAPELSGRGPGLTPAGDDVLAGLLLVARAAGGPASEPRLLEVVQRTRTTAVATAFLDWAARGQCIEPAHDVLHALAHQGPDTPAPATDRLAAIGASSGRALLLGIRIGLDPSTAGTSAAIATKIDNCLLSSTVGGGAVDGIADMGGTEGWGTLTPPRRDEPVFAEPWQGRAFALTLLTIGRVSGQNIDAFRYALARLDRAAYLDDGYSGRWLNAAELMLTDSAILAPGAIDARARNMRGEHVPEPPVPEPNKPDYAPTAAGSLRTVETPPRFHVGERVRARDVSTPGYTRLPRYARGHTGVVDIIQPAQVLPDTNAQFQGENPQYVYSVRFGSRELWGPEAEPFELTIDMYESYLEAAP